MDARQDATGMGGGDVVVEWAPFRLADGVDEAMLLEASGELQRDFLQQQPGFLRRELLRGRDGQWVDLVYWQNDAAVERVMRAVSGSAACHRYFQLMQAADIMEPGAGVQHWHRARSY